MADQEDAGAKKRRGALVAIFLIAVLVRLAFVTQVIGWNSAPALLRNGSPGPADELRYQDYAYEYVVHGKPFNVRWAPGEAGVLTAVYSVFGVNFAAARFASFLMTVVALGLAYVLARGIFRREDVALLAAAIAAVYPPMVSPAGRMLSEPGFMLLWLAAMILMLRSEQRQSYGYAIAAGVALGLCAYFRAVITYVPVFLLIAALWFAIRRTWSRAFRYALPIVAFALVISPWVVRNWVYTGRFILISAQAGHLLLDFHNPYSVEQWTREHVIDSNDKLAEAMVTPEERAAAGRVARTPQEWTVIVDDIKLKRAKEWIRSHPREELSLIWPRFLTFYQLRPPPQPGAVRWLEFALQWLVFALAVPALFVLRRFVKGAASLPWVLVAPTALQFPLWPIDRYHCGLDPFLTMLAAVTLIWLAGLARRRHVDAAPLGEGG